MRRNVATHDGGGVHTLTIDREDKRTALDRATLAELEAAFDAASERSDVRVMVLRGTGDRAFCAGADLTEDAREGITAFFEKRKPRWTAR